MLMAACFIAGGLTDQTYRDGLTFNAGVFMACMGMMALGFARARS